MDRRKIIVDRIENFFQRDVVPEAQAHTFRKYLSFFDWKDGKKDSALVNMLNSLGTQLRNDVKFFQSDNDKKATAPVLNADDLSGFRDYKDLVNKLREMPAEWTVLQISRELNPIDVVGVTKEHRNADPTLMVCRLPCGEHVDTVPPYMVRIPPPENPTCGPNIMDRLAELLQIRREYYNNKRDKKIEKAFNASEAALGSCLNEVECYWLREWKCLLTGRLVDSKLEKEVRDKITTFFREEPSINSGKQCEDIVFHLVQMAHLLKPKELIKAVRFAFYGEEKISDSELWAIFVDKIKSLNSFYSKAFKKSDRHPVILLIEPSMELFPWEMTVTLKDQIISRVLSLHLLYALFKFHRPNIINGYRLQSVNSAYCLLNPDKSLKSCEEQMGKFLRKDFSWVQVDAGEIPDSAKLLSGLSDFSIFMYCGHGSASQYFKSGTIKKAPVNGIVFLYGCASNLPRGRGGRTPYQNDTYTYLTNGCPALIGSLYDVSSLEADRASMRTMTLMLPQVSGRTVTGPVEPNVLRAVVTGKTACLKFWSKCCFVVRGIPVKIVVSDTEKLELLKLVE